MPHHFQDTFAEVFMIAYIIWNILLHPTPICLYVMCMVAIRRLVWFWIIRILVVITVFSFVLVLFLIIRFDVLFRSDVLMYHRNQHTFFSVLNDHHKPILIFLNYSKTPQTITNWMAAMILTLHEFWLFNLELDARSSNCLFPRVNFIDDVLSKPKLAIPYCIWWVRKEQVLHIRWGFANPHKANLEKLMGFQSYVIK